MSNYPHGSPGAHGSNMPTGASGLTPRRSSYASVVAGGASAHSQQYQSSRSGAFANLLNPADMSYESTSSVGVPSRPDASRYMDMDFTTNGNSHGRSWSGGRGGQLPSWSSAFGSLTNGSGFGGFGGTFGDHFFTPSYLRDSRYMHKLEDAYRAKVMAHKDGPSAQSSQPGSLSTSASSMSLQTKTVPSHRGLAYDVIEKAPPIEDETVCPLPSRWNSNDKNGGLEVLSDGQEVRFTGPKATPERDHEACSIRADHFMPQQCGIYYYEVNILSRKREEYVPTFS